MALAFWRFQCEGNPHGRAGVVLLRAVALPRGLLELLPADIEPLKSVDQGPVGLETMLEMKQIVRSSKGRFR